MIKVFTQGERSNIRKIIHNLVGKPFDACRPKTRRVGKRDRLRQTSRTHTEFCAFCKLLAQKLSENRVPRFVLFRASLFTAVRTNFNYVKGYKTVFHETLPLNIHFSARILLNKAP